MSLIVNDLVEVVGAIVVLRLLHQLRLIVAADELPYELSPANEAIIYETEARKTEGKKIFA